MALTAAQLASAAISASGSTSPSPTTPGADPTIGVTDYGRLTITAGSVLASDEAVIGDAVNGIGDVLITGFNNTTGTASTWSVNRLTVGDAGTGRLEIVDGAIVNVDFATAAPGTGDLFVGVEADSLGTIIVSGLGSMLRLGDDAVLGATGDGILIIEDEGYVIATNDAATGTDTFTLNPRGRVELNNGRLRAEQLVSAGAIIGSGRIDSEITIANNPSGRFEVGPGDRMVVNGGTAGNVGLDNDGEIAVVGGEIEFVNRLTNTSTAAEVSLLNGLVRFPTGGFGFDSTAGVLASTGGVNDIYGTVRIQGASSRIVVAGESTAVFHDPVTNSGSLIEVFPGSTAVYLQGLTTTGSGSALAVHLADPDEDPGFGAVEVAGSAALDGTLQVQLAVGFVPSVGDAFQILTASGGRTGTFTSEVLPTLSSGLDWELQYTPNSVVLSVISAVIPGDYNADGVVDAADYVVWRKTDGSQAGYDEWRTNFGRTAGSGTGMSATAAVPEPAGILMVLTASFAGLFCRGICAPTLGRDWVRACSSTCESL